MKFVIQRVSRASVSVDGAVIGKINKGFLVLIGIGAEDGKKEADLLVRKMCGLRIFEDQDGKTNLALKDVDGELLLISQFTLYANCKKGNRPSFIEAKNPEEANALYEYIIAECKKQIPVVETGSFEYFCNQCELNNIEVQKGIFGADMKVELLNDGPFTVIVDSKELM